MDFDENHHRLSNVFTNQLYGGLIAFGPSTPPASTSPASAPPSTAPMAPSTAPSSASVPSTPTSLRLLPRPTTSAPTGPRHRILLGDNYFRVHLGARSTSVNLIDNSGSSNAPSTDTGPAAQHDGPRRPHRHPHQPRRPQHPRRRRLRRQLPLRVLPQHDLHFHRPPPQHPRRPGQPQLLLQAPLPRLHRHRRHPLAFHLRKQPKPTPSASSAPDNTDAPTTARTIRAPFLPL